MKGYFKVVFCAIFLGGVLAYFFYKDINEDVKASLNESNKAYLFQVGVYKNEENAINEQIKYDNSIILKDSDYYRVIIAVTKDYANKDKLTNYYDMKDINYYIKEINIEYLDISKYDSLLKEVSSEEALAKINEEMLKILSINYNK